MASKKILLGIGMFAAAAIVFYAVTGWPPVSKRDTQGAIGVAQKYQSEQISEQDVVLADPDVQALLQTDFFYQLVTDANFQKLYLDGVLEKAVAQIPATLASASVAQLTELGKALSSDQVVQAIASGKFDVAATTAQKQGINVTADQLASFTVQSLGGHQVGSQNLSGHQVSGQPLSGHQVAALKDLGKALSSDEVKQHIAAGKFDLAVAAAQKQGITITPDQLSGYQLQGYSLQGHGVATVDNLGKALTNEEVKQHIAAGKFDLAAAAAQKQGVQVTADQLAGYGIQSLGAKSIEDVAALGNLFQTQAFQKSLPYAGSLQKLMVESGTFKNAVKSGDMAKFSQDIAASKKDK